MQMFVPHNLRVVVFSWLTDSDDKSVQSSSSFYIFIVLYTPTIHPVYSPSRVIWHSTSVEALSQY